MTKILKKRIYTKTKKNMLTELDNYPDVLLTNEVIRFLTHP